MPGSQILWWERIKTSKAKIRRARLGKGGDGGGKNEKKKNGPVSPQPPRVFRISYWTTFHLFHHYLGAWNRLLFHLYKFDQFSRDTSHVSVRPIKTFLNDKPRRKFFPCTLVRDLSNFVQNLQTSSCFYKSGNHGLTKSSHQVFNYVALTKS